MTSNAIPVGGTVLFVCTGNVCRSPYMAAALSSLLQAKGRRDIVVESAGTNALVGEPIAPVMRRLMANEGLLIDARARQLDREMLDRADLVVTASRSHRSAVVKLRPASLRSTFTLRQAGRLLAKATLLARDDIGPVVHVAEVCADRRGQLGPSAGVADDVPDPWGRHAGAYTASVESMRVPLNSIADALI